MDRQEHDDDLRPLADLTSAARERLNYLDVQGSRRLSRQSIIDRSYYFGRPDYEPVISSPLRQPSWDQETVSTPRGSPDDRDYRPLLTQGYDDEPLVLHPPGLERVSPEIWAGWYVRHAGTSTDDLPVPERPASPLQLLSESSEPDYTNTSFPFLHRQEPIGSNSQQTSIATSGLNLPPLNPANLESPRPSSPVFVASSPWSRLPDSEPRGSSGYGEDQRDSSSRESSPDRFFSPSRTP
jgi:hypothetical protein